MENLGGLLTTVVGRVSLNNAALAPIAARGSARCAHAGADRAPLTRGGAPARQPRPPPRPGRERDPRRRPRHPARGPRRLPRGRARGRADSAAVTIGASRVVRGAAGVAHHALAFLAPQYQRAGRSRASRSETEGSSRWTSSPTPSASASSTRRSSTDRRHIHDRIPKGGDAFVKRLERVCSRCGPTDALGASRTRHLPAPLLPEVARALGMHRPGLCVDNHPVVALRELRRREAVDDV